MKIVITILNDFYINLIYIANLIIYESKVITYIH